LQDYFSFFDKHFGSRRRPGESCKWKKFVVVEQQENSKRKLYSSLFGFAITFFSVFFRFANEMGILKVFQAKIDDI
jgi:hypothetical protein